MKALIRKDAYVLWKQVKLLFIGVLFMATLGGAFNSIFIVVWSSMLPYTAIAYDERSHWDQLAAMMPYTKRDLVLSKYVMGWACMSISVALSLVIQTAASRFMDISADPKLLIMSFFMGTLALDITLPLVFRLGVEKGRLVFMAVIFGTAILGGIVLEAAGYVQIPSLPGFGIAAAAAVIATAVSIPLSMKLYHVK